MVANGRATPRHLRQGPFQAIDLARAIAHSRRQVLAPSHRLPGHPHDGVGAGDVLDQVLVQVNPAIKVVLRQSGMPGRNSDRRYQDREQRCACVYHTGTHVLEGQQG